MVVKTKNIKSRREIRTILLVVTNQSCYKDKDLNKSGRLLAQVKIGLRKTRPGSSSRAKIAPEEHSFSPRPLPLRAALRVEVRFRLCTFPARRGASP
jgi:hypothetical protein